MTPCPPRPLRQSRATLQSSIRRSHKALRHGANRGPRLRTARRWALPHPLPQSVRSREFHLVSPPPSLLEPQAEMWPSGRRHTPAKGADGEPSRGFESLRLRHYHLISLDNSSQAGLNPSLNPSKQKRLGWVPVSSLSNCIRRRNHQFRLGDSLSERVGSSSWQTVLCLPASSHCCLPACSQASVGRQHGSALHAAGQWCGCCDQPA
jgi:hypothetical protein